MVCAASVLVGSCGRVTTDGGSTPEPPDDDPGPVGGDPASCGGGGDWEVAKPLILAPAQGAVGVVPGELVIQAAPYSDPVPEPPTETEIELWRESGGGLGYLVWTATLPGAVSEARLTDGSFVGGGTLAEWTRYAVRWRYLVSECRYATDWSDPVFFRTDDGSSYLFEDGPIRTFALEIPPESYASIDAEAVPPGCVPYERSYYPGGLAFEGQRFEGVGLRAKGGCGSARHLSHKAAFLVNLEWDDPAVPGCPARRLLHGVKKLTFNNGMQDPTALREVLGYELFRALGLPAPRAVHARLEVNGEYWGLYVLLESFDRRYLRRRFASNDGMLYEGTYHCDLVAASLPASDEELACLSREFRPSACNEVAPEGDPLDYTRLRELVASLELLPAGGFYPQIESLFDFDRFLTQWAANAVLSHWDSYQGSVVSNYRVYHDPSSGLWTLLQTGIDQAMYWDVDAFDVVGLLAQRCLAEPECEARFAARLHEVVDVVEAMDLPARAGALYQRILPHVTEDPRRPYDLARFVSENEGLLRFWRERPAVVREQLRERGY